MDERRQFARRDPPHHLPQRPPRPARLLFFEDVEFQDRVGHVGTDRGHLLLAEDVPAGEFHEPAAVGQAGEARLDEAFPGQAVQDYVNAPAARGIEDILAESRPATVEDVAARPANADMAASARSRW